MDEDHAKAAAGSHYLVAIFDDATAFRGALQALLSARFDRARISVLAEHSIVADRFGGTIPPGSELADRPERRAKISIPKAPSTKRSILSPKASR